MKWTLDQFREAFFRMEKDNRFLEMKIQGVYFWKLVRADILASTRSYVLELDNIPRILPKLTERERRELFNKVENNPFSVEGNVDYIILDRGKKQKYGDALRDIFTYDIEENIKLRKNKYIIVDYPYMGEYFQIFDNQRKNIESAYEFFDYYKRNSVLRINDQERVYLDTIKKVFRETFKVDINRFINFEAKAINEVNRFNAEKIYYRKLFMKLKPKKVFTTIYYRRHSAVAAAQELGIKVVDIQYANVNINHPGLGFPVGIKVPYYPDEVVFWGEFFKKMTPLPEGTVAHVAAPSYFLNINKEYSYIQKESKNIVFISQDTLGEKLLEIAYKFAKENTEYQVVYRLHPGEMIGYKEYKNTSDAEMLENFRFSTKDTDNLNIILRQAEYQVGVYSTAMIEGILHYTKSIFVNLPGVEEFEIFYNNGIAPLVNNPQELREAIKNFNFKNADMEYFYKDTTLDDVLLK